jgi:outer membrane lipoprotein-sorting protein
MHAIIRLFARFFFVSEAKKMRHNRSSLFALCIAAAFTFLSGARAGAGQPPIVKELQQKYAIDKGLELHFDLAIFWAVREKTEKKKGVLYLAPDDKFRAEVDNTVWVSDGTTYWQYSQGTNQVIIKDLLDVDLSMHPSQAVAEYFTSYDYTVKEQNDDRITLVWNAPEGDPAISEKSIRVRVDPEKKLIKQLQIVDRSGNTSTYTFTKTRVGVTIAPEKFTFLTPQGANVLDTRE